MIKPKRLFYPMLVFLGLLTVDPRQISADSPMIAGVAGPSVNMIYAYVPQDAGLWKKHGLDVRMVLFEAGSTLAQVARAGEVKFAVNSGPTTIASRTQGADSVIIAISVNTLPYSLVTAKGITKWADLKGKKVGISRFGSDWSVDRDSLRPVPVRGLRDGGRGVSKKAGIQGRCFGRSQRRRQSCLHSPRLRGFGHYRQGT